MHSKQDNMRRTSPLWFVLFLLCASFSQADTHTDTTVELVLSGEKSYYRKAALRIENVVNATHPNTRFRLTTADQTNWPTANSNLLVAVGSNACKQAMQRADKIPLLCTFLPSSTYWNTLEKSGRATSAPATSAVFFDQPMSRYFALIKLVAPKAEKLGTAVGPQSTQLLPRIEQQAQQYQLQLHQTELDTTTSHHKALSPIVAASDLFLVNPDKAELNKSVAKTLLHLSIRQRIPVIAYSGSYVNAGALAAIYSTPENIGRDAGELVSQWLDSPGQPLPTARYPNYFTIKSNPNVARSLGIKLPGDRRLENAVKQAMDTAPNPGQQR
ncbi:ABC transporter substrate binding protein [Porticoccus sp. W117]|uniref:ABC transporter substrate-binding protein n=1 Tax=Porticoccus sp. W117 TaxID=3054777 RepID=UPI0025979CDE|nr:ABC transporter substrate binding protein [Porticoccus sp. W117]MDM3870519.1 ABC transporter substrate binding protein [Porticoccus sp. W117]